MISFGIFEEENELLNELRKKLNYYFCSKISITVFNRIDQIKEFDELPDFLILDTSYENQKGLGIWIKDYLERRGCSTKIIFVSDNIRLFQHAYGTNVIGFIEKNAPYNKLKSILDRYHYVCQPKKIEWSDMDKHYCIDMNDIVCIYSQDKYTCIETLSQNYLIRRTMNDWEQYLDKDSFFRVNRFNYINFQCSDIIGNCIRLNNGKIIPIPHGTIKKVKSVFSEHKNRNTGRICIQNICLDQLNIPS